MFMAFLAFGFCGEILMLWERERLSRSGEWHNLYAHQASRNACVRLRTLPFYSLNLQKEEWCLFYDKGPVKLIWIEKKKMGPAITSFFFPLHSSQTTLEEAFLDVQPILRNRHLTIFRHFLVFRMLHQKFFFTRINNNLISPSLFSSSNSFFFFPLKGSINSVPCFTFSLIFWNVFFYTHRFSFIWLGVCDDTKCEL